MSTLQEYVTRARLTASEIRKLYDLATRTTSSRTAAELREFRVRFQHISRLRQQYEDAHIAVIAQPAGEKADRCIAEASDCAFEEISGMLYSIEVIHDLLFNDTSSVSSGAPHDVKPQIASKVSLPKITLPTFTGEIVNWTSYISLFRSLIHDSTTLNDIQKMHYLTSTLQKEPFNLIKHLPVTEANYSVAYQILLDRYENKRLIADKHLEAILALQAVSNPTHLRKFVNILKENIQALSALKFEVESWSFILLHIVSKKLPSDLRSRFERDHSAFDIPTFNQLMTFLETQLRVLENISSTAKVQIKSTSASSSNCLTTVVSACPCCNQPHAIYQCEKFDHMTPEQRNALVIKLKLCFNCLRSHSDKCKSKFSCRVCQKRHHTKLHPQSTDTSSSTSTSNTPHTTDTSEATNIPVVEGAVSSLSTTVHPPAFSAVHSHSTALLPTAVVTVLDRYGRRHRVRAVLDPASHLNLITERLAQKLNLKRTRSGSVDPVGETNAVHTNGSVLLTLKAESGEQSTWITEAWVMKRISKDLPLCPLPSEVKQACEQLELADPQFDSPGPIDMLIGNDLSYDILLPEKQLLGPNMPKAFNSKFGWTMWGVVPVQNNACVNAMCASTFTCTLSLEDTLLKFWETEEPPRAAPESPENIQCEQHFVDTHSRDQDGRFIVRLPFKAGRKQLGDSYNVALKRFHNLERRLLREPKLREMYTAFMQDYLEQGHMRVVENTSSSKRYYLPHHGVLKESSSTTKLRTVFDASTPSSSGVSLNSTLMSGPKLQKNIEDIILLFRLHNVVFVCDAKQMYRQVKIHEEDCRYQTILWRDSPDVPVRQYELTTVTYGVSSSAYLAMRVIHELATLNREQYPEACQTLLEAMFVDNIVSGSSNLEMAKRLQCDLIHVLGQGGFKLRKWSSSHSGILENLPQDHLETPFRFEEAGDHIFKILGMEWSSQGDHFLYHVLNIGTATTKRGILSNIARLYDPCGYLTPVTFTAKTLMQGLWLNNLGWDDALPADIREAWQRFVSQLADLSRLRIPRHILSEEVIACELHGFSDASERGYAAVVYLRVVDASGQIKVSLVMAKSRVAPIKQRLTIPKLELCGALLVARLLSYVRQVLEEKIKVDSITSWCDSTIALSWIRTPAYKLQTYEANRVSQIQGLIAEDSWRHVPSEINPADCASRGLYPEEVVNHHIWWSPEWLADQSTWPVNRATILDDQSLPGLKVQPDASTCLSITHNLDVTEKYSSLARLQAVIGWCRRFAYNARNPTKRIRGHLTLDDLDAALLSSVKLVQRTSFPEAITALKTQKPIKGTLLRLSPFLDPTGIMRVGGRLVHSNLSYEGKHPIILPKKHNLSRLIIEHYHRLYCHAGTSALLAILQRRFWILCARSAVRRAVFQCLTCFKQNAKPSAPFMGDLPSTRTNPAKTFENSGADFCGPFVIRSSSLRGSKTHKAYLCIFVCFATKATHLELVSDLTTEAFLACLSRFVSRRGLPANLHTDCGTNFVGARRHLEDLAKFLSDKDTQSALADGACKQQVKWHLNPPLAPHMGGLWETAVRSCKLLLKRVIGEQVLTFEELQTVFAKIEAVLNSRPLCPLSSDPENIDVLTPGHFIIGQPLLAVPERNVETVPTNRLRRWGLVEQITQRFWRRWQAEYLHSLQERMKWTKAQRNLNIGDLVLIQDPNSPPLVWKTGRITKVFPGMDNTVRVVEVRTPRSTLLRPSVRVIPLPEGN